MKKILFLFALVTLSACQKNEPDLLLGKNASQRIAEANEQLKNTLSQAPNGWKMSYFPKKNSYGGFTFLMKFTTQGRVTMVSDYPNAVTPQESSYQIQESQGPLLVFTTKNYIHNLLEPIAEERLYSGLEGEFQFAYMGKEGDKLKFRTQRKNTQQFVYLEPATASEWGNIQNLNISLNAIDHTYYLKVTSSEGTEDYFVKPRLRLFSFVSMQNEEKVSKAGVIPTADGFAFEPALQIGGKNFSKITAVPGTSPQNYTATNGDVTIELKHFSDPTLEFESQGNRITNGENVFILFGGEDFKNSPYMSPDFFRDFFRIDDQRKFLTYELLFNTDGDGPLLRIGYLLPGGGTNQAYFAYKINYEIRDKKIYLSFIEEYPDVDEFYLDPANEDLLELARERLTNFIALSSQGLYLWKTPTVILGPVSYIKSIAQPNYYFPALSM